MRQPSGQRAQPRVPVKKISLEDRREEPEDNALGRSRGGFGTKPVIVTCGQGIPLAHHLIAGHAHESTVFEIVADKVYIGGRPGR